MGEGTGGGFTEEAAAAAEASPPLPPLLRCRVSALSQATPGLYQTLLIPELTNEDPE